MVLFVRTHAHSWDANGNAAAWIGFNSDLLNNFAFEMSQYLDVNSGGLLFTKNNRYILDPVSFIPPIIDRPQMAQLVAHL